MANVGATIGGSLRATTMASGIKATAGAMNGYIGKQRGHGVGIYVQNMSDKTRLIENNTIFNNYYICF